MDFSIFVFFNIWDQEVANSYDFIIDTASGDHPFDPYMSLLKKAGVLVLVGFPGEVKFSPANLILGTLFSSHHVCFA